uniref:Uncharacterized protein LOC111116798 n=1 Tax=Crassostrea virginica TaxID=6565 RepID=A0A8B8C7C2_CRAVI|nr:uncharacterized protein LOC111116798 [Crassostrea virginica]
MIGFVVLNGIIVVLTYDDLSIRKTAIQSTTEHGRNNAFQAANTVDGNITTCMRTQPIGAGTHVPHKTMWWKMDLGGVYNIYRVNILFRNYEGNELRQRSRFAGFSLYISNSGNTSNLDNTSLCYKDGPQLPPLNFTTTCITTGQYVIFYNERLDGDTYPAGYEVNNNVFMELCEVQVYGFVRPDVYGSYFNEPCPSNCRYNICHIQKGVCSDCEPGWTGIACDTECNNGWPGQECKHQCSGHCVRNGTCNHVTGQCDSGCAAGWNGPLCFRGL